MYTCPKCNKRVEFCCSNPNCVCRKGVDPENILISEEETLACPHCGHSNSYEFWEDRSLLEEK